MSMIERILSWCGTVVLLATVTVTMLGWHPVLVVTRWIHPVLHRKALDLGIGLLMFDLRLAGWSVTLDGLEHLPPSGPLIVVSNHQHLFDIPLLMWFLRRYYPKFVAKQQLGRGFPCASYILRTGGSALIDRSNAAQALREIGRLGALIEQEGYAACIFPEGTRAREGTMKRFKPSGVVKLLESAPSAPLLPVVIDGTWKLSRYNFLPVPWRGTIKFSVQPPLLREGDNLELLSKVEGILQKRLAALRNEPVGEVVSIAPPAHPS